MSNKLAARHKSSLTLKSPIKKSIRSRKKYSDDRNEEDHAGGFRMTMYPTIFCLVFFFHWIVLCPLIWALLYRTQFSEDWPSSWPYLYWIVALLVWVAVMLALVVLWRARKKRHEDDLLNPKVVENSSPSYNTNVEAVQPEVTQLGLSSWKDDRDDGSSIERAKEETRRERRKKLAPLVIHQSMTGLERTENSGDVSIETAIARDRDSLKSYLKLVTVQTPFTPGSPAPDDRASSDIPMSPRELFFIDLIREAERSADKVGSRNSRFFDETKTEEKREAHYFIADVETPVNERTEIFIEIEPTTAKPRLTLESVSNESAEPTEN